MKISSKGEYALRALIALAKNEGGLMQIKDIANETLVSPQYLEQILLHLKSHGYVKSKRGVHGGYTLKELPNKIIIGSVIRDLEGPLAPMSCVSVTAYEYCPLEDKNCLLKPLWALIRDQVAELLDHTSLKDLLEGNLYK
ncbi:Rrf2 family transcriptional regulator [Peribacillus simplex]|uniref:Rrf2 family transcriptional regulator n=2 Tax=Peribacillus TaxID=2675229 RepID=A0AA90NYA9_9BACI|nr:MULTISPECIES: Rrf2 family transcriptional regulator [Peribacillus]MDP1417143.1 Rrf2 family transcriptional regulator [Peribacillus simplex]MDP1449798.1 Rrf2 family transcriptional regulator [Peribacillus frigoritolerans]